MSVDEVAAPTARKLAALAYPAVFRTDFEQPGYVLFDLGSTFGSQAQRQLMVDLKEELSQIDDYTRGRTLYYQSMGRFDQQVTTKPHRDGGPEESILMLGYEPTTVESKISFADYSHCAMDLGITPAEFLDRHNPMFPDGRNRLTKYTTELTEFNKSAYQILVINNSITQLGDNHLQGVLHTAEITDPNPDRSRVVNSTMIACGKRSSLNTSDERNFIVTSTIRREAYSL